MHHHLKAKLCPKIVRPACDVLTTVGSIRGELYDDVMNLRIKIFLDILNMKPGDRLFDHNNKAIRKCKVGVAVFSPSYCESLVIESKKRIIPIFCDVR